jgi:hypothetical protein
LPPEKKGIAFVDADQPRGANHSEGVAGVAGGGGSRDPGGGSLAVAVAVGVGVVPVMNRLGPINQTDRT